MVTPRRSHFKERQSESVHGSPRTQQRLSLRAVAFEVSLSSSIMMIAGSGTTTVQPRRLGTATNWCADVQIQGKVLCRSGGAPVPGLLQDSQLAHWQSRNSVLRA